MKNTRSILMKLAALLVTAAMCFGAFGTAFALTALPTKAAADKPAVRYDTPAGYNDHDYQKMVAFLEYTNESGWTNGMLINENYSPFDPETWSCVSWTSDPSEKRIDNLVINEAPSGILDVSGCTELTNMKIWCYVTEIDASGCTSLTRVDFRENDDCLVKADLTGCSKLVNAIVSSDNLEELTVSGCTSLEYLSVLGKLTDLDLSGLSSLQTVWCDHCELQSLVLDGCSSLDLLGCSHNQLTELDLSGCPALTALDCEGNQLAGLDISPCPMLEQLSCGWTGIGELDVSGAPELVYLQCNDNLIKELDVSRNPELSELICSNNMIRELDLSNNPLLPFNTLRAEGRSYIGIDQQGEVRYSLGAFSEFLGWYSADGEYIGSGVSLSPYDTDQTDIVARFKTYEVNANEHEKLLALFESTNSYGEKIGPLISESYDPDDFTTWYENRLGPFGSNEDHGVTWIVEDEEIHARALYLNYLSISGGLDLSGFEHLKYLHCGYNNLTEINISGCSALRGIYCMVNNLSALDVSGCPELIDLECAYNSLTGLDLSACRDLDYIYAVENELTSLDVSSCPVLEYLYCDNNSLAELDVSCCPMLWDLSCCGNSIAELDLSANPYLRFDSISADGEGTVAFRSDYVNTSRVHYAVAQPNPGESFLGWYAPTGEFISSELYLKHTDTEYTSVIARFGEVQTVPGDADGSGAVDTTDALYVLRCALGISGDPDSMLANCDMDGNGIIDTTDALLILRIALHIG